MNELNMRVSENRPDQVNRPAFSVLYIGRPLSLSGYLSQPWTIALLLHLAFLIFLAPNAVSAQEDSIDQAPPPLKIISKEELEQLDSKRDIKDRTKLSLKFLDARLTLAEGLNTRGDYDGMFRELGGFHGVMDDAMHYLHGLDKKSGKVLDNFKRLEIALRGFVPRIAVIRRELPLRYDSYVRKLLGYLRTARTKATETFFGETVIPPKKPANSKPK